MFADFTRRAPPLAAVDAFGPTGGDVRCGYGEAPRPNATAEPAAIRGSIRALENPSSRTYAGRCQKRVVVATDSVSANVDYDNGTTV